MTTTNKNVQQLVQMKINNDGTVSKMENGPFPGQNEIPKTKKGSEIDRYIYEVNGRKIYEWDQNLEGEKHRFELTLSSTLCLSLSLIVMCNSWCCSYFLLHF